MANLSNGLSPRAANLGSVVMLISRRGAGIWTNLPSLSFQFLRLAPPSTSMLWIDFGLRYEMLNHFRIQPSSFPAQSCLIGLAEMVKSEGRVDSSKVIPFDTTLSWPLYTSAPRQSGSAKSLDVHSPYRRLISDLAALGNRIYMVPFQLPELAADAPLAALSVEELNFVVESMITALAPTYTVFTCEGQPEAHLFSDKLADDNILQWC